MSKNFFEKNTKYILKYIDTQCLQATMAIQKGDRIKRGDPIWMKKKIQILQIICIGALEVFIKQISFKKNMTELFSIHIK